MNIRRSKCCVIQEVVRGIYARVCFCLFIIYSLLVFVRHLPWLHIWGRTASRTFVFPAFMEYLAVLPVTQPDDFWVIAWCSCCFSFASVLCTLVNTLWNPARCSCVRSQCSPVWTSRWVLITVHCACVELECYILYSDFYFNCCLHINTKSHCSTDERWWSLALIYIFQLIFSD